MSQCPSREAFDRYMYQSSKPEEKKVLPKIEPRPKPSCDEESWDHVSLTANLVTPVNKLAVNVLPLFKCI